jgi:hypothetical protein
MALRLDQISQQINDMAHHITSGQRRHWLREATSLLRELDEPLLRSKIASRGQRVPWLVAKPLGPLQAPIPCPPCPADFSVIAADGSNMPPDRHSPVRYYVINTGTAVLTYGQAANAELASQASFCHEERDLYFDAEQRQFPIEGNRLSALMLLAELRALREVAYTTPPPMVALLDGTLILWMIQTEPEHVRTKLLTEFLEHLDWFAAQHIPIVGYISDPGSYELSNTLRIYLCPSGAENCQVCGSDQDPTLHLCHELRQLRDPVLLRGFLAAGDRTCLFASTSEILKQYDRHQIQFFYLRSCDATGQPGEVVRVELPAWVAAQPDLLDLVHAVLSDQCRRSGAQPPYPPALHEAHEQAVISTSDRELVELLIDEQLARRNMTYLKSAKARHKRSRGV